MLENILREYLIDFSGHWNMFLLLCKFSYNNSYHNNIGMSPFDTLYETQSTSPIGWFKACDAKHLGNNL